MGAPMTFFQDKAESVMQGGGSTLGKLIGSVAGILLLIKIISESFYIVPVGYRGVIMHGGQPIRRRVGKRIGPFIVLGVGPRTGPYRIKAKGIGIKIPFYTTVKMVDIQERTQDLPPEPVDCPDGQRLVTAQLVTRIPCELDGPEYADFPARVVIRSNEPDQMFESHVGAALVQVLESASRAERNDRTWLTNAVNTIAVEDTDRVGYILERINLRSRALTPIQKAINSFGPPQVPEALPGENDTSNVVALPHPVVLATAELGLDAQAESS